MTKEQLYTSLKLLISSLCSHIVTCCRKWLKKVVLWVLHKCQKGLEYMKNSITRRLSLRAKFKSTSVVEVVIMDDCNNIQVEQIPVTVGGSSEEEDLKLPDPATSDKDISDKAKTNTDKEGGSK